MTANIPTGPKLRKNSVASDTRPRQSNMPQNILLAEAITSLIFAIMLFITGIYHRSPQPFIVSGFSALSFLSAILIRNNKAVKSETTRAFVGTGMLYISAIVYSLFFGGISLPVAICILSLGFIVASSGVTGSNADKIIAMALLSAMITTVVGTYEIVPQINIEHLQIFANVMMFGTTGTFVLLWFRNILLVPLRVKILLAALLIVLLPLSIMAIINTRTLQNSSQAQTKTALTSSAGLLATRVDDFMKTNRASVSKMALMPALGEYIEQNPAGIWLPGHVETEAEKQFIASFDSFQAGLKVKERAYVTTYALLDKNGMVIYSSDPIEIGQDESLNSHYIQPYNTGRAYYSPVEVSQQDLKPYIFFSSIVRNKTQNMVGVLRIKFDARVLQSFAKEYTGALGSTSYPIILDENFVRLADAGSPELLFRGMKPFTKEQITQLRASSRLMPYQESQLSSGNSEIAEKLETSPDYFVMNFGKSEVEDAAVSVPLDSMPWRVLYLESQSVVQKALDDQNKLITLIATVIAGIVSLLATLAAQIINNPIMHLTTTAQAISSGNLDVVANIKSRDELGVLGNAFNLMTTQLKQMVSGLEERVRERTSELAIQNETLYLRARQFETVAEVAKGIASARNLELLLSDVTQMVSNRFGFYHVGIFLIDEDGENAVLRAANSEGGKRMLARQHKLRVGQVGIVGYVTSSGEARIATDVGKDAIFFNNPDLRLTRSEMALPLKVGDKVIGALDVQSIESNVFTQEDIQLFSILADQVAIAIYNNKLYTDAAQSLAEAQSVHRRYLLQEWNREIEEGQHYAYRYTPQGVVLDQDEQGPDTSDKQGDVEGRIVPIQLRGETIGMIQLHEENTQDKEWSSEEIGMIQAVADQVALALENARLFTQTARRADRERRVFEITSKIRSTNDPQAMLQIAVEELQKALRASRAQVILQPNTAELASNRGGNGSGDGHP